MPPKRRRRFQGLYYHSSPPKVLPMNGQTSNQGRKRRDVDEFAVKLSTIRIWMHEKDIGKLTRILWAGQGSRLCQQASTNPRVKRFLSAVPYVMNSIKDVHQAVIDNNLETLQAKMEPPVPSALITCRDANGLNLIHKAAGLGHTKILEYLIGIWPDGAAETDITGKTALHWAACHKNNMCCYTLLTEAGCDEEAMDYKMKSPTYYRHRPHEIERAFLVYVPEAPRVSPDIATDWEALSEDVGDGYKKLDIKIPDANGTHGSTNEESIENTSEVDLNDGLSATEENQPTTPLTNDNGSNDSIPQTPIKYEIGTADEGEGEEAPKGSAESEAEINGNGNDEEEVVVEAGDNDDAAADETAEPEVEPAEEETIVKTLNETTTATANVCEEHVEEGKNETIATTEESKGTAESGSTDADDTNTEQKDNKEAEEAKEAGVVEAANGTDDGNCEEDGEVLERVVEQRDDNEESVERANKDSNDEEAKEIALAIDTRIGNERDVAEEDKEVAPSDEENQMDATEHEDKNNVLENIEKDEIKLHEVKEGAAEKQSDIFEGQDEGVESEAMSRVTRAVDDIKKEADGVEDKVVDKISMAEEEIEKVNEAFLRKYEKVDSEDIDELESEKGNETFEKETENNRESVKVDNEDVNVVENNKRKDEEIEKETERIEEKENDKNSSDSTSDKDKGKLNENGSETQNYEKKEPEMSMIEAAVVGSENSEKADSSNVNLNSNKNDDMNEESSEQGRESINHKDSEVDAIQQFAQFNTSSLEDENTSNNNGEKKISNEEASAVNDKTEDNESNETNEHVENTKQDKTLNNNIESEVKPINGETKDKLHAEQVIDKNANMDQTIKTTNLNANDATEQTSGKIPRLTTAKPMRGRQNGSAKRNGSARKQTAALIEGENESEEDDGDEDESEQNNVKERTDEAETENENKTVYEVEPKHEIEDEDESATEYEPELEDDVHVISDDQQTAEKLDENHNVDKYDNGVASSPTSSLAIEGFVTGVSDDNRVQSQSAAYSDVRVAIESGDMEQLAQIVLNGDGNKLVNMKSHNPDIQAFLNNVPSYMSKIHRVHEAAREGSLLALQQALDRRKFAIAKDETSPNGATPLHVAVLFGNTDIVRYLAARFPETTATTDNDERTALHYAATINDNGHFYNILTQLGANSKAVDKLGHTPEFYQNNEEAKDILNYRQLLTQFGAGELEEELLNDQGQAENASSQMNPIFKTEQGKYLANNLADPLIKALTEIANKRPEDPVAFLANYLQNYLHHRNPAEDSNSGKTNSTAPITSSSPILRRTGTGLHGVSNTNSVGEQIEDDHISNADDDEETHANLDDRDEHGQSMLHFACARSHRRGALTHLIEESNIDITYRDELYRTARDVALQANQPSNAKDIDRYLLSLTVIGDVKPFETIAVAGYDHIVDITDDNEVSIVDVAVERGHDELAHFLRNLRTLEELREELHQMIRDGNVGRVKEIVAEPNGKWLVKAKNYYGRTALHIAVLKENEEIVEHFVRLYPESLKIGDNLERTALHYAMGTNAIESLSRILIQKGAKRTTKDLKGRQPSYYFMNKADILRLQEEEAENRQAENASSQMNPIFKTEQGKYLANNLADPLIKALTEIANKRPEDPVAFLANYLQNYLHHRNPTEDSNSGKTNSTAPITSSSPILRRTGTGLHGVSNTNSVGEQIEDDHISNADDDEETHANLDDRDEHGQSMLHFACARSHRRGALTHLIEESNIDITYRDELYRTARDVALQANQPSNAKDIDRYLLSLTAIGDVKPFETIAVAGYDHIVDITDDNEVSIVDVAVERGHDELAHFLRNLRTLEELREELHQMIRDGNVGRVKEIVAEPNGKWLVKAKNYYGRTALHIAVLKENEEIVEHFVRLYPESLKIGDNLERTALHYAMGTNAIESLSRILIQKGAKRTTKDLKGRQPSYYFMNKADILRLQEEEAENR